MKKITHCIFDMDGLLLDTEHFYTVVQQSITRRFGKEFTWDLKAKMMGKKALEAAELLVSELGLQGQISAEQFLKEREEALDELFPTSQLLPGAERLLRHLHNQGIPFCLATSSHRRHFELKTASHGQLFELFTHIVTGDLVTNGKPAPDLFRLAASQFEPAPDPSCCLVFEDAPSGIVAAKAAGMACVAVPDSRLDPSLSKDADQVLGSLQQFDPTLWGLPPFDPEE